MKIELTHCQLCDSSRLLPLDFRNLDPNFAKAKALAKEQSFASVSWNLCMDCSFLFMNPRPSREQQEKQYTDSQYRLRTHDKPIDPNYVAYAPDILLRLIPWLCVNRMDPRSLKGANCLDFGCGVGGALEFLAESGNHCWGVEIDANLAQFGNQNFKTKIVSSVNDLPKDLQFDFIFANHSLEHIYDPNDFFAYAEQHLKPGGLLLAAVPAWRYTCKASTFVGIGVGDDCDENTMWDHVTMSRFMNKYGLFVHSIQYQHYGNDGDWELLCAATPSPRKNEFGFNLDEVLHELYCAAAARTRSRDEHPLPTRFSVVY